MSVDARFLLPEPPGRARVLAGADGWAEGLAAAGVAIVDNGAEVCIAGSVARRKAAAAGARAVLVVGDDARRLLRRHGYAARSFLCLPSAAQATVFLPLDQPRVSAAGFLTRAHEGGRLARPRNLVFSGLLRLRLPYTLRSTLTVGARTGTTPFVLAAAAEAGVVVDGGWYLVAGQGDALARGAFFVFERGARAPHAVVKFARVPGYAAPFERDERAYRLLADAGAAAARHAPRMLARFSADGFEAAAETAAAGRPLNALLASSRDVAEKHRAIEAVCAWLLDVWRESAGGRDRLAAEHARLREVVGAWGDRLRDPAALLAAAARVPSGVLVHDDLGGWNVAAGDGGFTVLDWERARRFGLPLWDLWYFLADVLAQLDGAAGVEQRVEHFRRLFRGEAPSSPVLLAWTRRAVDATGVPEDAVGALATLCWLNHGLAGRARSAALDEHADAGRALQWAEDRYPEPWLEDPALGPGWSRWRG